MMIKLDKDEHNLILETEYQYKELSKSVPGYKWNSERRVWTYPLDFQIAKELLRVYVKAMLSIDTSEAFNQWFTAEHQRIFNLKKISLKTDARLASKASEQLYPYQRVGVAFMKEAGNCLLADDMGLGKTYQAVVLGEELKAQDILIVCPNSLKWTWVDEIKKWLSEWGATICNGRNWNIIQEGSPHYWIINYEALRLHPDIAPFPSTPWDLIIFDETHRIKNRKAQCTKASRKLKAKTIVAMTGTPILNRPDELWSILHQLYPKKYTSYWRFFETYIDYEEGYFGKIIKGAKNQNQLTKEIAPIYLRREKSEVLKDLPEKTHQTYWVDMAPEQEVLYKTMKEEMIAQFDKMEIIKAPVVLAQLIRLKQLATHPAMIVPDWIGKSEKFEVLIGLLKELISNNKKIVVFSQFAKMIGLIGLRLTKERINYVLLTGKIPPELRSKNIEAFQDWPNLKVLLSTIQTGGQGITLTAADTCIFTDRLWTPAYNTQAEDRLHRIGQKSNVTIIKLLAKNTVEEYIERILLEKTMTIESIIKSTSNLYKNIFGLLPGDIKKF